MKPDRLAATKRLNNVLANKALILPTVNAAIEFSWFAHRESFNDIDPTARNVVRYAAVGRIRSIPLKPLRGLVFFKIDMSAP
ncbi:MAG: hypothetical protein IPO43_17755 [Rhodoferax sp.]|nr:hypothetical protein [Rhodoferax sp.]